jgi:cyclase
MTSSAPPDDLPLPPPTLEEVAPGAYAYIQPDGSWCLNNTGLLVGRGGVTAIDTCATEARSRAFLEAAARVSHGPVRTLVNTHHHGDHTHGNWLLPGATIIGHDRCRAEMISGGMATTAAFPMVEFGRIEMAPPFVTFEDRLGLWIDDLAVELVFMGPAHTTNDVVAWIPEHRLLYTGDLVFNGGTPFALMGTVRGWLRTLDRLRALAPERIVPGHGPVCGPEVLDEVEAYLRFVQDVAGQAAESGEAPLEAARACDLGRFGAWHDQERLVGNLHRALSELRGEPEARPLDYAGVWAEMVELNGGRPLRCLA